MNIIKGGISLDTRGQIRYVNEFDMSSIKRFYIIENSDTELIRGWRAHRIEDRWFYVISGSFEINIVQIDNWNQPSVDLPILKYSISAEELQLIHLPAGYGTAIRALDKNSELLVFANYDLKHASSDNYTWPLDYFKGL